jgi:hypothetical protein
MYLTYNCRLLLASSKPSTIHPSLNLAATPPSFPPPTSYRLCLHVLQKPGRPLISEFSQRASCSRQARILAASPDDLASTCTLPGRRQSDDHCFPPAPPALRRIGPSLLCARFAERFAAHGSTHRAPRILTTPVTPSPAAPRAKRHLRPRHPAHRCIADVNKARAAHARVWLETWRRRWPRQRACRPRPTRKT